MSVIAEKPATKAEIEERLALAVKYGGPTTIANLTAEFRRRAAPAERLEVMDRLAESNLHKCGLEVAIGGVDDDALTKRLAKRRRKLHMAAHDGPPTKEEIAELLVLDAAPGEDFSGIVAELLGSRSVAKSYTPTHAQIAKHDEPLANSVGF